jgi:hypothetical protein
MGFRRADNKARNLKVALPIASRERDVGRNNKKQGNTGF